MCVSWRKAQDWSVFNSGGQINVRTTVSLMSWEMRNWATWMLFINLIITQLRKSWKKSRELSQTAMGLGVKITTNFKRKYQISRVEITKIDKFIISKVEFKHFLQKSCNGPLEFYDNKLINFRSQQKEQIFPTHFLYFLLRMIIGLFLSGSCWFPG